MLRASYLKPRILLVEGNLNLSENIQELLEKNDFEILKAYDSIELDMDFIRENTPDLLLVDINISGKKTGIELANELKRKINKPLVLLSSSSGKDIVSKTRNLMPEGFIVKPFTTKTLITSIELALINFNSTQLEKNKGRKSNLTYDSNEFFIRENGWLKKIRENEIHWIKTEGQYSQLFAEGKQYTLRNTAKEILSCLNENHFQRVHKSYIINLKKIDAINSSIVKIQNSEIPIGRNFYKDLLNSINKVSSR